MRHQMKIARLVKGLTQRQLGKLLGCSELDISRVETGRKDPGPELRARIAHVLGRAEAELFPTDATRLNADAAAASPHDACGPDGKEVVPEK